MFIQQKRREKVNNLKAKAEIFGTIANHHAVGSLTNKMVCKKLKKGKCKVLDKPCGEPYTRKMGIKACPISKKKPVKKAKVKKKVKHKAKKKKRR